MARINDVRQLGPVDNHNDPKAIIKRAIAALLAAGGVPTRSAVWEQATQSLYRRGEGYISLEDASGKIT